MVNAIAGGGTLLTFPALLAFGTPPVIANATSTVALVLGTAGSFFGYRKQIAEVRPWLRWFAPVSLLGGLLGGILLTSTRESIFAALVPFLFVVWRDSATRWGRPRGATPGPWDWPSASNSWWRSTAATSERASVS
jgi:uncharacterized membrane protein YfcA